MIDNLEIENPRLDLKLGGRAAGWESANGPKGKRKERDPNEIEWCKCWG